MCKCAYTSRFHSLRTTLNAPHFASSYFMSQLFAISINSVIKLLIKKSERKVWSAECGSLKYGSQSMGAHRVMAQSIRRKVYGAKYGGAIWVSPYKYINNFYNIKQI